MNIYSEKVMEHFMCPQNVHSMPDADAVGCYGDTSCGDYVEIYIKVTKNIINDISYLVFGCSASIATSSMTSVLAKGKSLDDAMHLAEYDILEALDGLPQSKQHCSNLAISALRDAIIKYRNNGSEDKKDEDSNTSR